MRMSDLMYSRTPRPKGGAGAVPVTAVVQQHARVVWAKEGKTGRQVRSRNSQAWHGSRRLCHPHGRAAAVVRAPAVLQLRARQGCQAGLTRQPLKLLNPVGR